MTRAFLPWRRIPPTSPELSDLLAAFDACGERPLIARDEALATLARHGNDVGSAILAALPHAGGVLDPRAADAALLEAHIELQRLSEEFDHGRRVAEVVRPLLEAARRDGSLPLRVTDVGCGLAYVPRYLGFHGALGPGVALSGRDFNPALIERARASAREERIDVDLRVGDAMADAATPGLAVSTGVLHHFDLAGLHALFARQRASAWGFAHFDFQPSPLAPFGAWLFHRARFRSALARHDGVLSALRAHAATTLLDAARDPDGRWSVAIFGARLGPFPRVFHAVVGVRAGLRAAFEAALGSRARRLGAWH